jgi:glycosyltransferase involved in cell wall biosynthesis
MKPLITLGVCVRNGGNILRYAIESIINQDFPHNFMEIIFVNDGSKDNTLTIITNYALKTDIKSKVFSTDGRGTGPARNLAVREAEGEYLVWVDYDMVLTKSYISKLVKFMEENKDVGVATGILGIHQKANLILTLELAPSVIYYLNHKCWTTEKTAKLPGTAGSIYRLDSLRNVGGFDETIKGSGEDQDAVRRVRDAGWLICRADAVFYETHGHMSTWKDLWRRYFWHGYTSYDLYSKNKHPFSLYRMTPIAGFIFSILNLPAVYRLVKSKIALLLPIHFTFKTFAWCLGFLTRQLNLH